MQAGNVAHVVWLGQGDARQFSGVDIWSSDANIQAFYTNPQFVSAFSSLFSNVTQPLYVSTRELSCGTVGQSGMATCERDAREATRAVLIPQSCPRGVTSRELAACLESIRNARCGTAETLTDRLASCAGVELCR